MEDYLTGEKKKKNLSIMQTAVIKDEEDRNSSSCKNNETIM